MAELISVIVSTFEREDALEAVLRGLSAQTDQNFEVLVADDGSGPATAALVAAWADRLGAPLRHIWHAKRGFRLAAIRNRAISASRGDYCVFLDGDCIPRPDFVAAHRRLAAPGWFVAGNRVLLSRTLSERILAERLPAHAWTLGAFFHLRRSGELNRLVPLLRLPLGKLREIAPRRWQRARGCNLAAFRADLERVDGFDARFEGWGYEDSDLVIRLLRSGVRRRSGACATAVLHLWHPAGEREGEPENRRRLEAARAGRHVRARQGLSAQAEDQDVEGAAGPESALSEPGKAL